MQVRAVVVVVVAETQIRVRLPLIRSFINGVGRGLNKQSLLHSKLNLDAFTFVWRFFPSRPVEQGLHKVFHREWKLNN
jgi:hypothetical protein